MRPQKTPKNPFYKGGPLTPSPKSSNFIESFGVNGSHWRGENVYRAWVDEIWVDEILVDEIWVDENLVYLLFICRGKFCA